MRKRIIILITISSALFATIKMKSQDFSQEYLDSCSMHTILGVPHDSDSTDDFMIYRPEYTISYNPNYNSANWAAWNLNSTWIGNSGRHKGNFITDTSLPDTILKIKHKDYTNSGFDRGHIVRSLDRTFSKEANKSTFLMTNIIAQTPDLNRGVWLDFERFCENLARNEELNLYIYAGAVYNSDKKFGIGIQIPDSCYKIAIVLSKGEGLECVDFDTVIYSVMMPNIQGIRRDKWQEYARSVAQIEQNTGYNFFSNVPEDIQFVIEQFINK